MNGADFNRVIDDDLWNDIQDIFNDDQTSDIVDESPYQPLSFGNLVASGFRFRYQSEIDKKSFSSIKGERNQTPTLKILATSDLTLRIDLVTESSDAKLENQLLHFNTLYDIPKVQKYSSNIQDGVCFITVKKNCFPEIKLDFLGIRKWKLKEAIHRIIELYPDTTEAQARKFFSDNKETVKIRAMLYDQDKYIIANVLSNTIKSQNAKENKEIKIQHISPKTVADYGENLIIVLEKKITSECKTYIEFGKEVQELHPTFEDGQTFVYNIPEYRSTGPSNATVRITCSDREDSKPIRFVPPSSEARKRKSPHFESDVPLKKPTNYDSPQQLYPESGNADITIEIDGPQHVISGDNIEYDGIHDASNDDNIEFDGPHSMDVVQATAPRANIPPEVYVSGNESCKDSGIHSNDKGSNASDSDSDDSCFDEDDDDSDDCIEIEGVHRRRVIKNENLQPINFPPTQRSMDSHLVPNSTDKISKKIFSEVARIGHDFAFGKKPSDLFLRIEKQLPVVFTLQDDVGDTPLNNAILKGNLEQAEEILRIVHEECKWALDLTNTSGHTALILAPACEVPASFIAKLLDAGCRLDLCDDLDKSAITYAIEYKNKDALAVLLEYAKVKNMRHVLERSNKVYYSHLQLAVMNGFTEGVKMLLSLKDSYSKYMVDVNELSLMNKNTALHIAVERNVGIDIIKLLLEHPDIKINLKNDRNVTVLHIAMQMNLSNVVDLLKCYQAEETIEVVDFEETPESNDDMDDDEDLSLSMTDSVMRPVVEETPQTSTAPVVASSTNIGHLTAKMESMSLKGETRRRLINLLIDNEDGSSCLTVSELALIIKPSFRTLLTKYVNTKQHNKEIIDTLDRFNCLPNSLGQLCENLREINRLDIVQKLADHFHE